MSEKVFVTNVAQLKAKYGVGYAKVEAALAKLTAADKRRGLATTLVALDDTAAMKTIGGVAVQNAASPKENKDAIDAVFKKLVPDYLVILGSIDVVPYQDIVNPVYGPPDDTDPTAFGDLPYACENPYSTRAEDFIGPTRVVGRVPNVTGDKDPAYLVQLLNVAAGWTSQPATEFASYLGFGAGVWKDSTAFSLQKVFGNSTDMKVCPPAGPKWGASLKRHSHFINCHGALGDPNYYGQPASGARQYPHAHEPGLIAGRVTEGTIIATECCYGAELYDPNIAPAAAGQISICNTYLSSTAYGFLGSTTIAYGPGDSNAWADLMCQFFFRQILSGASLGRALLEARQEYIRTISPLGPYDLKTLAQYVLLGDPSIQPVATPPGLSMPLPKVAGASRFLAGISQRARRRQELMLLGLALPNVASYVISHSRTTTSATIQSQLKKMAKAAKFSPTQFLSYTVESPAITGVTIAKFAAQRPTAVHVAVTSSKPPGAPMQQLTGIVAIEQNGAIVDARQFFSR